MLSVGGSTDDFAPALRAFRAARLEDELRSHVATGALGGPDDALAA
jgi:hypothetical protein